MSEQPKRGRGPGRPMLGNLRNAGPLLKDGEVSRPVRVRAAVEVHVWLSTMNAAEVGAVLARAMVAEGLPQAEAGASAPARPEASPRPAEGPERLALGNLPADLALSPYQRRTVDALRAGGSLTREHARAPWVLSGTAKAGTGVRGDTVQNLIDLGVLREV